MHKTHVPTGRLAARRIVNILALLLMAVLPLSQAVLATEAAAATLQTDLYIYSNGDTVTVTGDGWTPGETISLVTRDPAGTVVDTGSAVADGASAATPGHLTYQFILNGQLPGIYTTAGTGQTSGDTSSVQFDPGQTQITASWDSSTRTVSWIATGLGTQCYRVRLLAPGQDPLAVPAVFYDEYPQPDAAGYDFFHARTTGPTVTGSFTIPAGAPTGSWAVALDRDSGCNTKGTNPVLGDASTHISTTFTVATSQSAVTVDEGQTATDTGTWCTDADGVTVGMNATAGTVVQALDVTPQAGCRQSAHWTWSYPTTDGPSQSQTVTITATDSTGLASNATINLTVNNVNPTVSMPADASIDAGATFSGSGSFSDPGADSPWTATVDYGTGTGAQPLTVNSDKTFNLSHTYPNPGSTSLTYTVTVTVTDKDGGVGTGTVTVIVGPGNHPPVVAANTPSVTVDEGQTATQAGTWSDPDAGDTVSLSASTGTVTQNSDGSWSWSLQTTDGPSDSQTVTITATDSHKVSSSATFGLTVNNVAPTGTFAASSTSLTAGDSATLSISNPSDPSTADTSAGFTYSFSCDGTNWSAQSATPSASCTFPTGDSVTVRGRIYDKDGGYTEYQAGVKVAKKTQTVTFDPSTPTTATYLDAPVTVTATASSGLTVTYSIDTTVTHTCTLSGTTGNTVTITGAGSCTIIASQGGDPTYQPASASITIAIGKAGQTITFPAIADKTYGAADFDPGATTSSPLPVTYQASGNCTIVNGQVHITGVGSCTVTASQSGDANYKPAADVSQSFAIAKADQTITFGPLSDKTYGDSDFAVSATATSGLAATFTAAGNCSVSGATVHITGAGSCTVTASQNGSTNYNAATPVPQTFTINRASQTITFGPLANKTYGDQDFAVSATASSGLSVTFSATGNCTVSGSTVHITGAGTCTITASQGGNINYKPAADVSQTFTIAPAKLTVTADNESVQYSDALPSLAVQYSGFVLHEGPSVLSGTVTCTTTAATTTFGSTTNAVNSPAGTYPIDCSTSTLTSPNYTISYVGGTLNVTQEDAQVQYTGDTIGLAGSTVTLRASAWDSAAGGYPGPNPETGSGATVGDITTMWIAFDVYGGSTCYSGQPTTYMVQVGTTGTSGVGTASTSFTSPTDSTYCVVARLVGKDGGTNQYYSAPNAQSAALIFYTNTGQFVTGGGWILDPNGAHGNFGFNARYNKSGSPQGQMVYVYRGMYNGVLADYVVKSNSLSGLMFSSKTYPISAILQGKCNIQINSAANGKELLSDSGTFTATVTDSGQSSGIGSDTFSLNVSGSKVPSFNRTISTSTLHGGNVVVHNP